jgi:hypothetical protein
MCALVILNPIFAVQVLMSISLTVHYRDTEKKKYHTPVVSYRDFNQYWKPIAIHLGLEWVLLIQNAGLPLERHLDDLPKILDELLTLKHVFQTSDSGLADVNMLERIERVIPELKIICDNPDIITEAFLG